MADGPTSGKKVLGQTPTMWAVEGAAGLGLYLLWRWYKSRESTSTTSTEGGGAVPAVEVVTGAAKTSTSTSSISSLSDWIEKLISSTKATAAEAYNEVNAWQSGYCVSSAGYSLISKGLSSLGLPPGSTSAPLTVCKTSGQTGTAPTGYGTGTASTKTTGGALGEFVSGSGVSLETAAGQLATGTIKAATGALATTIDTYEETVKAIEAGTKVGYITATTGAIKPITSVAQLEKLEGSTSSTAPGKGKQTTTYTY